MTQAISVNSLNSKKLRMIYALASEATSEIRSILENCSTWVPDPRDCCNIGFTHKDDLAQVRWSFDRVLDALSAIEDADWDERNPEVCPCGLLKQLQKWADERAAWLDSDTVSSVKIVIGAILTAATTSVPACASPQSSQGSVGAAAKEQLMFELCSHAFLGIYSFMEESTGWDHGLHHDEIFDVFACLRSTTELLEILYARNWNPRDFALGGLLRDLVRPVADEMLVRCSADAVIVIQSAVHALVDIVAGQQLFITR